jgi:protein subunit release factor B
MTKELLFSVTLDDCDVQTFRSGGKGGQHQNKTESGVRIIHRESGARGESREERSQLQNKKIAFRRMVDHPKFRFWVAEKRREMDTGKTAEERVAEQMAPENIKVEYRVDGVWVDERRQGAEAP